MLESRKVSKKYVPPSVKSDGRAKNNIEGTYYYSVIYGRLALANRYLYLLCLPIITLTISSKSDLIITVPIVRVMYILSVVQVLVIAIPSKIMVMLAHLITVMYWIVMMAM